MTPRANPALAVTAGLVLAVGANACAYAAALIASGGVPTPLLLRAAALALAALVSGSRLLLVGSGPASPARPHPAAIALFAVTLVLAALVAAKRALLLPNGAWDGWMIWNFRARWILRSPSLAAALPGDLVTAHADYPLLLPALVAEGWEIFGQILWWPLLVSLLFAALPVALLVFAVREARGGTSGLLAGAVLLSTPLFAWTAVDQCADLPLATFLLLAAVAIDAAQGTQGHRRTATFAVAGAALSLAAFTKNEGLAGLACFALSVLATPTAAPLRARVRDLSALAAGTLPVLLLLTYFKVHYAPTNDLVALTTFRELTHRAFSPMRWGTLTLLTLRHLLYFQEWGIAWPAAAAAVTFLLWGRRLPPASRTVWVALLALTLVYLAVLLVTPRDLEWHVKTTLDRLLLQLWPTLLFAIFSSLPREAPSASQAPASSLA